MEGLLVEAMGAAGAIGLGGLRITAAERTEAPCEVVGFRDGRAFAMPFGQLHGVTLGTRATLEDRLNTNHPSTAWLGRVVDALGDPIDGKGALAHGMRASGLNSPSEAFLKQKKDERADLASGYAALSKIVDGEAGTGKTR
jgi:flagellum-specific ATP synthase